MAPLTRCLHTESSSTPRKIARGSFWAIRCVLASALALFEPLVTFVLATVGAIGLLTAAFVSLAVPQVPPGHVPVLVTVSLVCFTLIGAYFALIAWLTPNN